MGSLQKFMVSQMTCQPVARAIMQRMAELSDDQGFVRETMDKILAPIPGHTTNVKYRVVQNLMKRGYITTQVVTLRKWKIGQSMAYYSIHFPDTPSPFRISDKLREKIRAARQVIDRIAIISQDTDNPRAMLAEIHKLAVKGQAVTRYSKEAIIENSEISRTGQEVPGPLPSDNQDSPGE